MPSHCDSCYGQTLHRLLDGAWKDLPGSWGGFDDVDLGILRAGFPKSSKTDADYMQHKIYDACLENVMSEARYTAPDGGVYFIKHNHEDQLALFPVETGDD